MSDLTVPTSALETPDLSRSLNSVIEISYILGAGYRRFRIFHAWSKYLLVFPLVVGRVASNLERGTVTRGEGLAMGLARLWPFSPSSPPVHHSHSPQALCRELLLLMARRACDGSKRLMARQSRSVTRRTGSATVSQWPAGTGLKKASRGREAAAGVYTSIGWSI